LTRFLSLLVVCLLGSPPGYAHTPVPLPNVPALVIQAVKNRAPDVVISAAAVDIENNIIMFAILGTTDGAERVFLVTAQGTLIEIHDRAYYEEHLED
jgi:hypothetical protein